MKENAPIKKEYHSADERRIWDSDFWVLELGLDTASQI